jgi:hypothetical protein
MRSPNQLNAYLIATGLPRLTRNMTNSCPVRRGCSVYRTPVNWMQIRRPFFEQRSFRYPERPNAFQGSGFALK